MASEGRAPENLRACLLHVSLILCLLVLLAPLRAMEQIPSSFFELLDSYSRGDFDGAVRSAAMSTDVNMWRERYIREAGIWISSGQPARRRLAAAGFALEVTRAKMTTEPAPWLFLEDVLAWACSQFRNDPRSASELEWHHALLALAQRAGSQRDLVRIAAFKCGGDPDHESYLEYIRRRYPKDQRLAFQAALVQASMADIDYDLASRPPPMPSTVFDTGATSASSSSARPLAGPVSLPRSRSGPEPGDGTKAIKLLEPFSGDPESGAEAEAHIAHLYLVRRKFSPALDHAVSSSRKAREKDIKYLAEVLKGQALQGLGRLREAHAAYSEALQARPDGESAALLLAAVNDTGTPSIETMAKAENALGLAPRDDDPVRLYAFGDYLRWQIYVDAFHRHLQ